MDMYINGINTSIPDEIFSKYPYITVTCSISELQGNDWNMNTIKNIRLIASAAELMFVPADLMYAAYGVYLDVLGSLIPGCATSIYSDDTGWGTFNDNTDDQPLLPISMMGAPVWTNYDIRKVTGQSADGSLILGDVYFKNSYTDYSETYEVTSQWLLSMANQARRLHKIEGLVNFTTDMMLGAFEEAPIVSKTNWMDYSTFDYANKTFHSDAEVIYAPPTVSFKSDVETVNIPKATEIRVDKIVNSNTVNNGWNYRSLFYNCASIKNINAPLLQHTGAQVFQGCSGLASVKFPALTSVNVMAFEDCTNLVRADFGTSLTEIGYLAFRGCTKLDTLILRSNKVVTYNTDGIGISDSSPIGAGTGYIYVPTALVDSYKAASKWSDLANQFRAIEDYPNICGTTA